MFAFNAFLKVFRGVALYLKIKVLLLPIFEQYSPSNCGFLIKKRSQISSEREIVE